MTAEPQRTAPDRAAIIDTTVRVLARMVQVPPDALSPEIRLFLDLGLTSTKAVELVMQLEDELEVDLQVSALDWRHLETLDTLTGYVVQQAAG